MKTYLIIYKTTLGGQAEYWCHAENKTQARNFFRTDFLRGEIDYESDGTILDVIERDY